MYFLHKALAIIVGSLLLSIGINFFLVPSNLLDGGVIGIGLIVKYLFGIKAGLTIIFVSIPIFIFAWYHYRALFYNSLHGMLISSLFIDLLSPLHRYIHSYVDLSSILSSILGGIFIGLGIGIMLRYETSTGGTDLLALFLAKVLKVNIGVIIFIIDVLIIGIGGLIISKEALFLSGITIIVVGMTTSLCVHGVRR